jgi:alpha-glucosidase (family GH31 glycosyl hydrolase)
MHGQGGNELTVYTASYTHITNMGRAFLFNTSAMGYLDFKSSVTKALFWKTSKVELHILPGGSFKDLAGKVSKKIGTMKALPEWILDGAVVGL